MAMALRLMTGCQDASLFIKLVTAVRVLYALLLPAWSNAECPLGMEGDGYCGRGRWVCIDPKERCIENDCCKLSVGNYQTIHETELV